MHRLFPRRFGPDDLEGFKNWCPSWAQKNTGTKWFPNLSVCGDGKFTSLYYDTAEGPNIKTLIKLSKLTGWHISIEYEAPSM